jgi:hypothetical protein
MSARMTRYATEGSPLTPSCPGSLDLLVYRFPHTLVHPGKHVHRQTFVPLHAINPLISSFPAHIRSANRRTLLTFLQRIVRVLEIRRFLEPGRQPHRLGIRNLGNTTRFVPPNKLLFTLNLSNHELGVSLVVQDFLSVQTEEDG